MSLSVYCLKYSLSIRSLTLESRPFSENDLENRRRKKKKMRLGHRLENYYYYCVQILTNDSPKPINFAPVIVQFLCNKKRSNYHNSTNCAGTCIVIRYRIRNPESRMIYSIHETIGASWCTVVP